MEIGLIRVFKMKKHSSTSLKLFSIGLVLSLCLLGSFWGGTKNVFAQSVSPSVTTINARILPTVWYSTLSVNDGDAIKIYAGIQNNSGVNINGEATFSVDDKEISRVPFSSVTESLIDVSTSWVANPGDHSVQVSVSTTLSADKALFSYKSDKSNISIIRKITPEVVQAAIVNSAGAVISQTDKLTSQLADNIESLKKPVGSSGGVSSGQGGAAAKIGTVAKKGSVLGTSTSQVNTGDNSNFDWVYTPFNFCLDVLAFLVRNWKWTLSGIIALFLLYKIADRFKK